jgi:hypothetical protein
VGGGGEEGRVNNSEFRGRGMVREHIRARNGVIRGKERRGGMEGRFPGAH